jgi:hypothetical protein
VFIDDRDIHDALKNMDEVLDTAVQSAEFAGKALTKTGTKLSISQDDARQALGLGALAYADTINIGVHKVSLEGGTNPGTLKLTTNDHIVTDNIAVTGLGSAAFKEASEFDLKDAAKNVLGATTDAAGAATVHGALNLANEIRGTANDGATANTVYGAHAAVKALADGAVKTNANNIKKLSDDIGNLSNIMNFRGVVAKNEGNTMSQDIAEAGIGDLKDGDVIIYGDKEFVYSGGAWHEFGDATGNANAIAGLTERVETIEGWKPGLANNTSAGLIKGTAHTVTDGVTTGKGVHIESGEVKSVSMDLLVNGDYEIIFCAGGANL